MLMTLYEYVLPVLCFYFLFPGEELPLRHCANLNTRVYGSWFVAYDQLHADEWDCRRRANWRKIKTQKYQDIMASKPARKQRLWSTFGPPGELVQAFRREILAP